MAMALASSLHTPGKAAVVAGAADDYTAEQAQLLQDQHPLVLDAQVDQEDAVGPALGPPAPVGLGASASWSGDDLEQQGGGAGGQGVLDAREQLHEERLDPQGAGRQAADQAEGAGPGGRQGPGGAVEAASPSRRPA